MCFSSESSLSAFLLGIISSILLIYFGSKKYNKENTVFGLYLFMYHLCNYLIIFFGLI